MKARRLFALVEDPSVVGWDELAEARPEDIRAHLDARPGLELELLAGGPFVVVLGLLAASALLNLLAALWLANGGAP